jgi:LPS-assembly lipoprotein
MMRTTLLPALVFLALAVAGCTVRPLYSNAALTPGGVTTSAALSSVAIKPVKTRYAQEVRNQMIFLLGGGQGQPTAPAYNLDLSVTSRREVSTVLQVSTVNEPSAAAIVMTGNYVLTDTATGKRVASGRRQISSQYDIPRQEFASYRAERDAENRAARELAEMLRLAVAQDLASHTGE